MTFFSLDEVKAILPMVHKLVPPTPAYSWPLLKERTGVQVIVKHENHTPTGSFKARGVPIFIDRLCQQSPHIKGFVTATRGNHGQSVALTAHKYGLPSLIVVPKGNSTEKNEAMRAFGGQIIVDGSDFEESRHIAMDLAKTHQFHFVPPFHKDIVLGVSSYAYELFDTHPDLDVVYAPIGMGSGVCGLITVRDLLGLKTEIVGVVAEKAPAFALSFNAGNLVATDTANTFADGIACRQPLKQAFEIIHQGCSRIIAVSEDDIAEAMRIYYTDTHNLAESGAAAALAGLLQEKDRYINQKTATILSGCNVDLSVFAHVLSGKTPKI